MKDEEDVSERYLPAFLREYGWNARWIWFPKDDRTIAWVGTTFAGEPMMRPIARWRVTDLLPEPRSDIQLKLGAGDPSWG